MLHTPGKFIIALGFFSISIHLAAQKEVLTLPEIESKIAVLGKTLLTDTSLTKRKSAHEQIGKLFTDAFKLKDAYKYPFDSLPMISRLAPPDTTFRIFTWQLYVHKDSYKYGGIVVTNKGGVFLLNDGWDKRMAPENRAMTAKNWYGALYYGIHQFEYKKKTYYALFGYDMYSFFNRRKIFEIFQIDNGKPKFGEQIVNAIDGYGREVKIQRYFIQYSAEVACKLNYDKEFNMIVYDNLVLAGSASGEPTNYPDGSFCGFKLDKKKGWMYTPDIFTNAVKLEDGEAPIFKPKKQHDTLFGN